MSDDYEGTWEKRDKRIAELEAEIESLRTQVEELTEEIATNYSDAELMKQIAALKAQVSELEGRQPVLLDAINADLDGDGVRVELSARGRYILTSMRLRPALPNIDPPAT